MSVASEFIASLVGKKVFIKLVDNSEYTGTFITLDGLFNLVLEDCNEVKTEDVKLEKISSIQSLKDTYIRGNNILYISPL